MSEVRYIAIEGVIGAGKTSLAKKLSDQLNARLVLEQFEINPFLAKFYQDQKRFAFQTQMFFLVNRYKQQQDLFQENLFSEYLITDYIFNKDQVFAYLNLSNDEIKLYESIFPLLARTIRQPDIVVYLQSSVDRLMANIKKRNRKIEEHISKSYIEELHNAYNKYFFKYDASPLLIVDVEEIDFVNNKRDYEDLVKEISGRIGLRSNTTSPRGNSFYDRTHHLHFCGVSCYAVQQVHFKNETGRAKAAAAGTETGKKF